MLIFRFVSVVNNNLFIHFVGFSSSWQGGAHSIALLIERGKPQEEHIKNVSLTGLVQKKITTMTASNMKNIHMKMFRTAYKLAVNPTVSLRQFKTLIKVQRQNGIVLVEGNNLDFSLYQLYCMLSVSLIFIC